MIWWPLLCLHLICLCARMCHSSKPNIVIIMADDMGFDDVSFRGSDEFLTPNIDALAYSGVILNNLYTPAMCTPSRSALLTGKYPTNIGMQHYVIANDEPWSLPINETTMAEIFQRNGYHTNLIGKWHLGFSRKAYTPTRRGFDNHFGYLGAYIDYYNHTYFRPSANYSRGHDFRENLSPSHKYTGEYVTDLLTASAVNLINRHNSTAKPLFLLLSHLAPHAGNADDPMQAPEEEEEQYSYIENDTRRKYAAMVARLDKSVGCIIDALAKNRILENTVVLFLSDNGGPTTGEHSTTASNYPLRGQKNSPWEGAIRSSAAIWSTQLEKLGTVWKQRIYIGDLLPTLAEAAGISLDPSLKLDGVNLWSALKYGYQSVEREILHNIDDQIPYFSYMKGKWKLINGTTNGGLHDNWLGTRSALHTDPRAQNYEELIRNTSVWKSLAEYSKASVPANISGLRAASTVSCHYTSSQNIKPCLPLEAPCLFNIDADPCEQNNLFADYQTASFVLEMLERIEKHRAAMHEPNNLPADLRSDPRHYNNEWTWWEDGGDQRNIARRLHPYTRLLHICSIFIMIVVSL